MQPHLSVNGSGEVELREFAATVEGVIESFATRYPALDQVRHHMYLQTAVVRLSDLNA